VNLRPDQLPAHLSKPLAPLYVVHGDEPLLVAEAGDALRAAARAQGYGEREVLVAHAQFKWDDLFLAAGNLSLFGGNKLVDLRIPGGKPGRAGTEALGRYCARLGPGVVTLITLPQLDWQARKTAWFVALQQSGVVIEANAPELPRLPEWIAARLDRQGQGAPRDALEFIAAHVEGNLLAAHQEIQKLALLHPPGALTREQVEDAVLNVARYDVDKLRAALAAGDAARCARLLDGLKAEGVAAPLVLWSMASEIRSLGGIRSSWGGRPGAAPTLPAGRLRAALLHAARIDRMIKGLMAGDVWDEFLQLALRITGRRLAK
jgi:DNA polymerase-3 subunit delta